LYIYNSKGNKMNNPIKQILISATVVAFTACGGGGSPTDAGSLTTGEETDVGPTTANSPSGASVKKLIKKTSVAADGTSFQLSEYTYNTNDLVEKSVGTFYEGDSEQGDVKSKTVAHYTYEKTYNMVKVVTKGYDENNDLTMTSTSWQTYSGDKVISMKGKTESDSTPVLNMTTEGNFTEYVGPIATKTTLDAFDKDKKLSFQSKSSIKVVDNKDSNITSTTTLSKVRSISSILRTFDTLDRAISSEIVSDMLNAKSTYSYDSDRSKIEPIYTCFGGYVQMAKNHRNKYPRAENHCYLRTEIKTDIISLGNEKTTVITYENTVSNGLVVEQKMITDGVVTITSKYEYK
jgi:hypothetical protein